ncbi:MAG: sodium ion-translocating decarboxylase subunit beta, partial [Bacteroidota bacterium]
MLDGFFQFLSYSGFANFSIGNLVMITAGLLFLWLSIVKDYEPLLLVPIGFGIIVGNIPFLQNAGMEIGIYEEGSVLNYLYYGVIKGIYPPLIFLGIGAMTDFSALISNPKLVLLGAASQIGIFITMNSAL